MRLNGNDPEIIETINYNGKYVDTKVIKKKLLSLSTLLLVITCFIAFVFFY